MRIAAPLLEIEMDGGEMARLGGCIVDPRCASLPP